MSQNEKCHIFDYQSGTYSRLYDILNTHLKQSQELTTTWKEKFYSSNPDGYHQPDVDYYINVNDSKAQIEPPTEIFKCIKPDTIRKLGSKFPLGDIQHTNDTLFYTTLYPIPRSLVTLTCRQLGWCIKNFDAFLKLSEITTGPSIILNNLNILYDGEQTLEAIDHEFSLMIEHRNSSISPEVHKHLLDKLRSDISRFIRWTAQSISLPSLSSIGYDYPYLDQEDPNSSRVHTGTSAQGDRFLIPSTDIWNKTQPPLELLKEHVRQPQEFYDFWSMHMTTMCVSKLPSIVPYIICKHPYIKCTLDDVQRILLTQDQKLVIDEQQLEPYLTLMNNCIYKFAQDYCRWRYQDLPASRQCIAGTLKYIITDTPKLPNGKIYVCATSRVDRVNNKSKHPAVSKREPVKFYKPPKNNKVMEQLIQDLETQDRAVLKVTNRKLMPVSDEQDPMIIDYSMSSSDGISKLYESHGDTVDESDKIANEHESEPNSITVESNDHPSPVDIEKTSDKIAYQKMSRKKSQELSSLYTVLSRAIKQHYKIYHKNLTGMKCSTVGISFEMAMCMRYIDLKYQTTDRRTDTPRILNDPEEVMVLPSFLCSNEIFIEMFGLFKKLLAQSFCNRRQITSHTTEFRLPKRNLTNIALEISGDVEKLHKKKRHKTHVLTSYPQSPAAPATGPLTTTLPILSEPPNISRESAKELKIIRDGVSIDDSYYFLRELFCSNFEIVPACDVLRTRNVNSNQPGALVPPQFKLLNLMRTLVLINNEFCVQNQKINFCGNSIGHISTLSSTFRNEYIAGFDSYRPALPELPDACISTGANNIDKRLLPSFDQNSQSANIYLHVFYHPNNYTMNEENSNKSKPVFRELQFRLKPNSPLLTNIFKSAQLFNEYYQRSHDLWITLYRGLKNKNNRNKKR